MRRHHSTALIGAALAVLVGCAQFPEVDAALGRESARAGYPRLIPLEGVLAAAAGGATAGPDLGAGLAARAARLRLRAGALRGPVIDAATRARMRAGVRI